MAPWTAAIAANKFEEVDVLPAAPRDPGSGVLFQTSPGQVS